MKDEAFIESILQKGKEVKEKARLEFSDISLEQLNWKLSAESWSIAQCLDHLIIADSFYFPELKKIIEGTKVGLQIFNNIPVSSSNWDRCPVHFHSFGSV